MNFSQKLGLFILILISVAYVYFSFFNKDGFEFKMPEFNQNPNYGVDYEVTEIPNIDLESVGGEINTQEPENKDNKSPEVVKREIKIFINDSNGNLRSVNRTCDTSVQKSCLEYAIKELVNAPTKWEKSKGFTSEIPQGTRVLSVREGSNNVIIDLSSAFESGGGTESTYVRLRQLIRTAKANTNQPVYLYLNGKQANVIGGEGFMLKQPLSERSLDE